MTLWTLQSVALLLIEYGMLGMLLTMPPALLLLLGLKNKGRWAAIFGGGLFISLACLIAGISLEGIETGVGLALSKSTLMVHASDDPKFFWISTVAFLAMSGFIFLLGCFLFWRGLRSAPPRNTRENQVVDLGSARTRHGDARMTSSKDIASIEAALDSLPEYDKSRVPLLLELLLLDGHDRHEDIVFDLGILGDPIAIPAIAKVAEAPPTYIVDAGEWTLHPFQRKCAYALARIGTLESRQVLEHFAGQGDSALSEYAKEGLSHWPMPYRP